MKSHKKPKNIFFQPMLGFSVKNLKRGYAGGKKSIIKHGTSGVIALIISSVVPTLEGWHADNVYKDEIRSVATDAAKATKESEDRSYRLIMDLDNRSNDHIIKVQNEQNKKFNAIDKKDGIKQ